MTIFIDDVSEPGSWARAIARGCVPNHRDSTGADERKDGLDHVDGVAPGEEQDHA